MTPLTAKPPIGPNTKLCMSLAGRPGVFGSRFHNFLYEQLGLDFIYKAFSTTDLPAAIDGVRALGVRGCAISMPFKETVIPLLDRLDGSAVAIESVNTIVNDEDWLTGYNTDYKAIADLLDKAEIDPATPFLLRGSGGMAKAVAAALRNRGHQVGAIIARNKAAGRTLADSYAFSYAADETERSAPLIINATPLGMAGADADKLSFREEIVEKAEFVFDVVASPTETPLIQAAARRGKRLISGGEVAVLQALEQFVLYTAIRPNPDLVNDAADYAKLG